MLSQALLPALRQRKGVIVNVGSDAALLGYAGCAAYCASKGALVGLTRALAVEAGAGRARALRLPRPGRDRHDAARASPRRPTRRRRGSNGRPTPLLGRVAAPREIAEAILFAASPRATFMTGSVIMADGGATAGKRV